MKLFVTILLSFLGVLVAARPPTLAPSSLSQRSSTGVPKNVTEFARLIVDTSNPEGPQPCKVLVHTKFLKGTSPRIGHFDPKLKQCVSDDPEADFISANMGPYGKIQLAYKPSKGDSQLFGYIQDGKLVSQPYVPGALNIANYESGNIFNFTSYTLPLGVLPDCLSYLSGAQVWTERRCQVTLSKTKPPFGSAYTVHVV
ncbi:hypothetical protein N7512_001793 [Penicillium capsulatum]|nr:hypothetical protein N7512_001793 [Penicillium capsulatum]